MTLDEAQKAIEELRAQGETDETMLGTFYLMFQEDEISLDELSDLCQLIGYDLSEEFRNMSPEDQKTKGWEEVEDEDLDKEEIEDAKEYEPGEEKKSESEEEDKKPESESKKPESESKKDEDEETQARKLFGF